MSYVIYNIETTHIVTGRPAHKRYSGPESFLTEAAAKAALTRMVKRGASREKYAIAEFVDFYENIEKKVMVQNLMSGKMVEQRVNTPIAATSAAKLTGACNIMTTLRYEDRPLCQTPDCYNEAAVIRDYHDGWASYRPWCSKCHNKRTAAKHGLKNIVEITAQRAGMTVTEYANQFHPYRKHRKDYCENVDGRLGYTCTTTIVIAAQLEVDHIDGNPANNDPENLQTLCGCCHKYKTVINEDYRSPGRKALNLSY